MKTLKLIALVSIAGAALLLNENRSAALTGFGSKSFRLDDSYRGERIYTSSKSGSGLRGFQLYLSGIDEFDVAVAKTLRDSGVSPFLEIRADNRIIRSKTGRETKTFKFYYNGYRLCDYHARAHKLDGHDPMVMGLIPTHEISLVEMGEENWPSVSAAHQLLRSEIDGFSSGSLQKAEKCLQAHSSGDLAPSWDLFFSVGQFSYHGIATDREIYKLQNAFFDVQGTTKAYEKNPKDGTIKTYQLELVGDTHLTSNEFTTNTGSIARAKSLSHDFQFDPVGEKNYFIEATAFTHITQMYEWFKSLGYEWGEERLTVHLHQEFNDPNTNTTHTNNAYYNPQGLSPSQAGGPAIALGDGDGVVFQDMALDSDVIGHEFGHHVVYRTMTSIGISESENGSSSDEHSLVLHEGLADFFTFAKTGDACLAESICVDETSPCQVYLAEVQCLRTAGHAGVYGSSEYWSIPAGAGHVKSQFLSAVLWDLHEDSAIDSSEFTELVYLSLDYLLEKSVYSDFIAALMSADKEGFAGKYGCKITEAFKIRGYEKFVDEVVEDCKNFTPLKKSKLVGGEGQEPKKDEEKKDDTKSEDTDKKNSEEDDDKSPDDNSKSKPKPRKQDSGCGVIGGEPIGSSMILIMMLFSGLLPLYRRK